MCKDWALGLLVTKDKRVMYFMGLGMKNHPKAIRDLSSSWCVVDWESRLQPPMLLENAIINLSNG